MSPVESATTPELLDELRRRFPSGIFAAKSIHSDDVHEEGKLLIWGETLTILGLVKKVEVYSQMRLVPAVVVLIHSENKQRGNDADGSR